MVWSLNQYVRQRSLLAVLSICVLTLYLCFMFVRTTDQVNSLRFEDGYMHPGDNIVLSDLSISRVDFVEQLKKKRQASPLDGICHKPFGIYHPPRLPALTKEGDTISDCWIDRPDFEQMLALKLAAGALTEQEGADLKFFHEHGYMLIDLDIPEQVFPEVDNFVKDVWTNRPHNLLGQNSRINAFAPTRLSTFPKDGDAEGKGSKLLETHAHSAALATVMFNDKLHHYFELIYEDVPVATQSLFFRKGSDFKSLHRDPWYVQTRPPGNMMAAWVALEDIRSGTGELEYVPGSHRMPYSPLGDSQDVVFAAENITDAQRKEHIDEMFENIKKMNLEHKRFQPKRGQALIWHADLIHGGSVVDPGNEMYVESLD